MPSVTSYKPAAHSLASQILGFFEINKDEHLTLDDITTKFDCTRGNIHTMLAPSVSAKLLVRTVNDDAEYIYSPGPATKPAMRDTYTTPASGASTNTGTAQPTKLTRLRKAASVMTDPDALQITDDPLPAGRASPGFKYQSLLSKLKQGQCIKCSPSEIGRVSSAMRKHLTNKQVKFAIRTIKNYGDGMGRVWWLAANESDDAQAQMAA